MKPPYCMPYNNRMDPKTIIIENLPGFGDLKFHKVDQPAFLDHSMESQAVQTNRYTLTEMEEALRKAEGRVYVYKCAQTWEDEQLGTFTLRWKVVEDRLAPLFTALDISANATIEEESFTPTFAGNFRLNVEMLMDLQRAWGRDEMVRQLGEYMAQAVEVRNYDRKPELPPENANVRTDPVDPHPAPTE